ncbi:peptidase M23 [Streptomyces flavochromogenes]|uniref:Peptidase M23 n=1 Tax=Streptomyces flavochromogenes TaxID=68199 RepID=A0ABW6Y346_9ACTN
MEGRDALRAAVNTAGTGAAIKLAVPASVVFVCFLLVVGVFGGGVAAQANADSCGDRGQPGAELPGGPGSSGGTGQSPDGDLRKKQIENAKVIDSVAERGGMSGQATLIGLMTALQESTLLNIEYGDRDSLGLFQQRPSQGWGTREQILNPRHSSKMFFFGADSGSPRGLADIRGWEAMPLWKAAATVQRPAEEYETLYAGQEGSAREIAAQAGIDLLRPAVNGPALPDGGAPGPSGETAGPGDVDECYTGGGGTPGKPGEPFHDGAAGWPASVRNPRSTAAAIQWAENEAATGGRDWFALCLAFVARVYGWSYSGVPYAIDHYREMPPVMKHDKDRNPPPGALMYWDTGKRAGHVAIYLGDGKIASNDIARPGYIDVVPATDIETKWGATYLGWAPPYFPRGG